MIFFKNGRFEAFAWRRFWYYLRIFSAGVTLIGFGLIFSGMWHDGRGLFKWEIISLLLRNLAGISFAGGIMLITFVLLVVLGGRFYCAALCPFGIVQDIAAWFSTVLMRRKVAIPVPDVRWRYLRWGIAGVAFCGAFCGIGSVLLRLDPYANVGRLLFEVRWYTLLPVASVIALGCWRRRFFCHVLCPAGTLLEQISRGNLLTLQINERCVKCRKCLVLCPGGCIDLTQRHIDNSRCLRCMTCHAICPQDAVKFQFRFSKGKTAADPGRRRFIAGAGTFVLCGGITFALGRVFDLHSVLFGTKLHVLPPGAGNLNRFAAKCIGCQLCSAACPAGIIVPHGGEAGTVVLDLNKAGCRYDCNLCSNICPSGALLPLTLPEKQRTRIALAKIDHRRCIAALDEDALCGKCTEACPVKAIGLNENGVPQVDSAYCIGCGACRMICPASFPAITMVPAAEQVRLNM